MEISIKKLIDKKNARKKLYKSKQRLLKKLHFQAVINLYWKKRIYVNHFVKCWYISVKNWKIMNKNDSNKSLALYIDYF